MIDRFHSDAAVLAVTCLLGGNSHDGQDEE
jgi:hypothetical protein